MYNIFFQNGISMALTIYSDALLPILSVRYARRLNPLKCANFDRLQAAVILTKGLLHKIGKANYFLFALNERTRGPDLL